MPKIQDPRGRSPNEGSRPLPGAAIELLGQFYRYRLFSHMLSDGVSVEFAGSVAFGLAKRASQTRQAELHRHGDPYQWFRVKFRTQCPFGNVMPPGRDVERSGEADVIFKVLLDAGPQPSPLARMASSRYMTTIDMGDVMRRIHDPFDQEVLDYFVYSGLYREVYR